MEYINPFEISLCLFQTYILLIKQFQVIKTRERDNLSQDFFSLAMRPSFDIRSYSGCIVGEVRFHMIDRDFRCTTQNSGFMIVGESSASRRDDNNFYVVLNEVLFVQYSMGRCI